MIKAMLAILSMLALADFAFAAETVTYRYDANGRLVAVTRSGTVNNGVSATYTHDKAGNRQRVVVSGSPR